MLLWFADLMNVTEEVAIHRPNVSTLLSSACCFCFFSACCAQRFCFVTDEDTDFFAHEGMNQPYNFFSIGL